MLPFLPTRRALLGAGLGLKIRPAPPNIILIVTDDQRWDALGCHEEPVTLGFLRTPNMDRLAAEGVRFRNAFVTTSLCSPSRASVLTGQYASTHGVESLEGDLAPGAVTFPALLRRAGYETAYIGKYHLGKDSDRPRPEYNHWAVFRGQGDYSNPTINVNGISSQATGYVTDVLTDQAIEFVTRRRARPFFLQLGHKAPHSPVVPPKHLERLYDGLTVPLPATYGEGHADKPGWFLEQHDHDYFHVLLHPREKY